MSELYRYYQTTHNKAERWKVTLEKNKVLDALHMTVFAVDIAEDGDFSNAKYWGNLVLDIDHGEDSGGLEASIRSAIVIVEYLKPMINNPDFLKLYASGKKGFHIEIPWKLFFAKKKASRELPLLYKHVAKSIEKNSGATGIDYALFSRGKGHQLRVANKPRSDGAYKVPISWAELAGMTVEMYQHLCSAPRQDQPNLKNIVPCIGLTNLLKEAKRSLGFSASFSDVASTSKDILEEFGDDKHPECINKLIHWQDVKDSLNFNQLAFQLAIYLKDVAATTEKKEDLVRIFAEHGHSSVYPTEALRSSHVLNDVLGYVENREFSCLAMKHVIEINDLCLKCSVYQKRQEAISSELGITSDENGYILTDFNGDRRRLTNFHIDVEEIQYKSDHIGRADDVWETAVIGLYSQGRHITSLSIDRGLFFDVKEVKKLFATWKECCVLSLTAHEADVFGKYIIRSAGDKPGMKYVSGAGLQRITYVPPGASKPESPMVWVEAKWSIASDGMVKGFKLRRPPTNITSHAERNRITVFEDRHNAVLKALLQCVDPNTVGIVLGWVIATQVKEHIIDRVGEFPLLHFYGVAGTGKTTTASLFARLGSADYGTNAFVVSGTTPHALRELVYSTTSIPRILDECGKEKLKPSYWPVVREILKACYQRSTFGIGGINRHNKSDYHSAVTYTEQATAPVIYISTVKSSDAEMWERSIELKFSKDIQRTEEYCKNWEFIHTDNSRKELLLDIGKFVLMKSLYAKSELIYEEYLEIRKTVPSFFDARAKNSYSFIFLGLSFFKKVCIAGKANEDVLMLLESIEKSTQSWLKVNAEAIHREHSRTELDNFFDTLEMMIATPDALNNSMLKSGIHYMRQKHILFLNLQGLWKYYSDFVKSIDRTKEFQMPGQVRNASEGLNYYLGTEKALNVLKNEVSWAKYDIRILEKNDHDFSQFIEDAMFTF